MPYHSSILPSGFVNEAPRALIAKTKNNQSQGQEGTLLKVVHSCLMSKYRWEDQCLSLKTSTFKPCYIIYQLGLGPNSVNAVRAVFLEPTSRLSYRRVGRGALQCSISGGTIVFPLVQPLCLFDPVLETAAPFLRHLLFALLLGHK
jgi:hypothetical protein